MKNKPIDNKISNKVESMLYRYYRQKKELKDIQDKIIFLEKEIERIEKRIRTTDVTIVDFYKPGNMEERVQTSSSNTSYAEQQITKAIEDLEKQQLEIKKKILRLICKEANLREFIYTIDKNIEMLGSKEKKFIELKYGKKLPVLEIYRQTCDQFNLEQASYYNSIQKNILENIAHWMNLIK